jgi:A/G-specific adenine glycosylase
MSIAFGARVPVLDGNVERVLARFSGLEGDPKRVEGRRKLLTLAESLLDEDRPGDSNQALMELGATVCRPRSPSCSQCPLSLSCVAFREGYPEHFPLRRGNKRRVEQHQLAVVVEKKGRTLLIQRSKEADLLAGLWEIPWVPWSERSAAERKLKARYGGRWHLEESRGWVRHSITFRDIRLEVYRGRLSSKSEVAESRSAAWVARADVERLAVSTLVEKVLRQADSSDSD